MPDDVAQGLWQRAVRLHTNWPASFERKLTSRGFLSKGLLVTSETLSSNMYTVGYYESGWPFYALDTYDYREPGHRGRSTSIVIDVPHGPGVVPMLLFYGIAWPGFLADTIFFAGSIATIRLLYATARSRRRISKGLCPKCAYPIGTSDVCTECGASLRFKKKNDRGSMGLPPPCKPGPKWK